jgi:hypothetical protein
LYIDAALRPRLALHYEKADSIALIGECDAVSVAAGADRVIRHALVELEDIDPSSWLKGAYIPLAGPRRQEGEPQVVGYLHLGGLATALAPGSMVLVRGHEGRWRVLAGDAATWTLLRRSRENPTRLRVGKDQILKHLTQRRPVYGIDGIVFAIKAWGEPPEGPGGVLILDSRRGPQAVRALTPRECWRLQGYPDQDFDAFCAVAPGNPYEWHRAAGNSIHAGYAAAVAARTTARARLLDAAREGQEKHADAAESNPDLAGGGPRRPRPTLLPEHAHSTDEHVIREATAILMMQSLKPLTNKTYESQQRQWLTWRQERGETPLLDPRASPLEWERALMDHYAFYGLVKGISHNTLHVRLYAIRRLHLDHGFHLDLRNMMRLKTLQRGLTNLQGGAVRKLAVTPAMLRDIGANSGLSWDTWDDAITHTAILTGFFALLRSCEYLKTSHGVDPQKCLRHEHLTFLRTGRVIPGAGDEEADQIILLIEYSKTDALGEGVELVLDADEGNPLCPVGAFNRLRKLLPRRFAPANAGAQVFALRNGRVLPKTKLQDVLKASAARMGFNPRDFTSHSLRAGGASAMYHNGFTVEEIKRRGRWESDVWKIYVQGLSEGKTNYTKRMTTHETLLRAQRRAA